MSKFITKAEYHKKIRTNRKPFSIIVWRKYSDDPKFEKFKKRTHYTKGLTKYKVFDTDMNMELSCFSKDFISISKTIEGVKEWTTNDRYCRYKIQLVKR